MQNEECGLLRAARVELFLPLMMTTLSQERRCKLQAPGPAAALLLGMLVMPLPAWAQSMEGASTQPVSTEAQADSQDPPRQTNESDLRGIATQAAKEAAADLQPPTEQAAGTPADPLAQVPAQQEDAPLQATDVPPVDAAATVSPGAQLAPVGVAAIERGVLFRIVPPKPAVLPAETAAAGDAGTASVTAPTLPAQQGPGSQAPVIDTGKKDAQEASYLLGTIHFGTAEEQGVDYAVLGSLVTGVETFVNEANIAEAWKSEYDGYRWMPADKPLDRLIDKQGMATAAALLPGVRPEDLARMKPWAVLSLLEARGESAADASMDARLQQIANGAGKRLVHLESLAQQLQALDCVPADEHVRVLDERLRQSWILRIESAEAMAFYRSRNLDAWLANIDEMEGLTDEARAIEQRARHCLLEERNARWIGQLQTLFQDGPCFVAVGAIHLVGPDGLIARLRRDGYAVEAVPL